MSFRHTGRAFARSGAWVWLLTCLLLAAGAAHAAAPSSTQWNTEGCSGCHLAPTQISALNGAVPSVPSDGRGGTTLSGLLDAGLDTIDNFWTKLNTAGGSMGAFATSVLGYSAAGDVTQRANYARLNNIYQYLRAIRNTYVESASAASGTVEAVPLVTDVVNLGTLTFGVGSATATATVTITNPRAHAVNHGALTLTGASEIAAASGCGGTVPAGGTCTITVTFTPTATGGSKSATLALGFTGTSSEQDPASRSFRFDAFTNLRPTAGIAALSPVAKNATVQLNGLSSSDPGGSIASYAWTITRPDTSTFGLSGSQPTFTALQVGTYQVSLVVTDNLGASSTAATASVSVSNTAPIATPNFNVVSTTAPTTINLLGSGTDANGDAITGYSWSLVVQPSLSTVGLSPAQATAQNPSVSVVKSGTYQFALQVSDGTTPSAAATVSVTLLNSPPTASAGPTQNVTAPVTVNLNGATASDPNGDALTYAWTFKGATGKPAGSAATISNATSLTGASFNADKSGTYVLTLTVTDTVGGGTASSDITINAANTPPSGVSAGTSRTVTVNQPVTLAGAATDANGDTLTYSWSVTKPGGGAVPLTNGTTLSPSFTPDVVGAYAVTLTASDGNGGSTTSAVTTITAQNAAVANAGSNQLVATGSAVALNGSASTSTVGGLTYAWTLPTKPAGSTAALSGATSATPSFTADLSGTYVASLQVTDSLGTSPAATVTITADRAPVANAGSAQTVVRGTPVTLDGRASSDPDGDAITYAWTLPTRPGGSGATLAGATAAQPTFTPDVAGTYVATLVVSDGRFSSAAASVTVTVGNPPPQFAVSGSSFTPSAQVTLATTVSAIVSNAGGQPLVLGTLAFSGAAAADYTLDTGNGCASGGTVAAGGSCTLVVRFAPTATGTRAATLAIPHNAAGSPGTVAFNGTGTPAPQGRIALGALSLTFNPTQVNSSTSQTVTVQNTGDAPLTFSAFTLGGTAPGDFSRAGTCSTAAPLGINAQCTLVVGFTPTATGTRSATLTVASDASNGSATLTLQGTGVPIPAPAVTLSTAALDFGAQTLGGLYPKRSITVTNSGTADLTGLAVTVQGTGFTDGSATPCPATLAANASCTVDIGFTPTTAGVDYTGALRVASNAAGSPHVATLAGRGSAAVLPVLVWQPAVTKLDFGNVTAGSVSAVQSATLLNQGPGGVTLTLLNAVGPDSAAFSVTAGSCTLGQPLFEGQTCSIQVRFAPGAAGAKAATVQVASSGSFPTELALAGTGLGGPSPQLAMSAQALAFDTVRVGTQSLPSEITLTGSGSGVVTVLSLDVTGPYAVQPKSCPAVPFTLPVGAACTLAVTFSPQAEGSAGGKLTVTTDANPAAMDVALSGNGQPQADLSGGGCSLARGDSATDPTLWVLLAGAIAALLYRRRARRAGR